jgi:hypothetical protein
LSKVSQADREDSLTSVILLIAKVAKPKYPCITKPARMHLISEMPDPAAYFDIFFTRWAAMNENEDYGGKSNTTKVGQSFDIEPGNVPQT